MKCKKCGKDMETTICDCIYGEEKKQEEIDQMIYDEGGLMEDTLNIPYGKKLKRVIDGIVSQPSTPPIHSDPAGEPFYDEILESIKDFQKSETERGRKTAITLNDYCAGIRFGIKWQKEQTGRTYTEGGWTDAQMIKAYEDGISAGASNATRQYGDGWETQSGKEYLNKKRKKKP